MSSIIILSRLAIASLLLLGFLGTINFANANGTFTLIEQLRATKGAHLDDSHRHVLLTQWTGLEDFDRQYCGVMAFWRSILDGSAPAASLISIHFFGQVTTMVIMMRIESFRVGNKWTIVSFITTFALLIGEYAGMALAIPAYCLLHLCLSPIATATKSLPLASRKAILLVHPTELKVLPWSLLTGYGIPTAMIVCSSTGKYALYGSEQFWITMRQLGPVWTSILHVVFSIFWSSSSTDYASQDQRNQDVMKSLRKTYAIAKYVAIVSHIGVRSISMAARMTPNIFADGYAFQFSPGNIFHLPAFWQSVKVNTIGEGALYFLQWTELIDSFTVLVWAVTLYQTAATQTSGFKVVGTFLKTSFHIIVGGPALATVALMEERDQLVLCEADESTTKKSA